MMKDKIKRGFHQQAARASWMAPIVAFFMMAATNSTMKSSQSPLTGLIISGIYFLLLLAGICFGIIGCFGAKRYGARTTVVPGLLGAVLSASILGLIIAIAVPNFVKARAASVQSKTQALQELISQTNEQLPVMADDETRLDKIAVLDHDFLEYQYTFVNAEHTDFDVELFTTESRKQIVERYRAGDELQMYRDNQISVRFSYYDKNGELITTFDVTPDDAL